MIHGVLKELRDSKNVSQQKVADYLEITRQAYSFYELGKREPDYETLLKLAEYFNTSVGFLLGEQSTSTEQPSDEAIKFALFDGEEGISDKAYEEVKRFAEFVKQKYKNKE